MTRLNLTVILLTVALSALAQVCLKLGAATINHDKITGTNFQTLLYTAGALLEPVLILGLTMYALSALSWIWVLSKTDISVAYPFVSLSFVLTLFFGVWLFGESLTSTKIIGTTLIVVGCVFILKS